MADQITRDDLHILETKLMTSMAEAMAAGVQSSDGWRITAISDRVDELVAKVSSLSKNTASRDSSLKREILAGVEAKIARAQEPVYRALGGILKERFGSVESKLTATATSASNHAAQAAQAAAATLEGDEQLLIDRATAWGIGEAANSAESAITLAGEAVDREFKSIESLADRIKVYFPGDPPENATVGELVEALSKQTASRYADPVGLLDGARYKGRKRIDSIIGALSKEADYGDRLADLASFLEGYGAFPAGLDRPIEAAAKRLAQTRGGRDLSAVVDVLRREAKRGSAAIAKHVDRMGPRWRGAFETAAWGCSSRCLQDVAGKASGERGEQIDHAAKAAAAAHAQAKTTYRNKFPRSE